MYTFFEWEKGFRTFIPYRIFFCRECRLRLTLGYSLIFNHPWIGEMRSSFFDAVGIFSKSACSIEVRLSVEFRNLKYFFPSTLSWFWLFFRVTGGGLWLWVDGRGRIGRRRRRGIILHELSNRDFGGGVGFTSENHDRRWVKI